MKIKDVVYYAAMFLQLEDACSAIESGTENGNSDVEMLVRCANLVVGEVAEEYIPLITKETVTIGEDGFLYAELSKRLNDIRCVRRKNDGKQVKITQYFDRFTVRDFGEYEVTYSYLPASLEIGDEIPRFGSAGERTLAYGTACEYALISGMTDEAATCDARYKASLENLTRANSLEKRVKRRIWR